MFKKALVVIGLLIGCAVSAKAEIENSDVANSTSSVSVSVSSSVATSMDATCVPGRKSMEIQNLHASANMFCGFVSGDISTTAGRKITAGSSWILGIRCYDKNGPRINVYCINDSASAAATAWVTQLGNR